MGTSGLKCAVPGRPPLNAQSIKDIGAICFQKQFMPTALFQWPLGDWHPLHHAACANTSRSILGPDELRGLQVITRLQVQPELRRGIELPQWS